MIEEVIVRMDKANTIVGDIVRCRECKYAHMTYGGECKYCDKWSLEDSLYLDGDFFCSYGCRDSEKPNNCEHITEDGVTCAKYPACDDCLDNPLNKVKGVGKTDRFRKE